jgi:hypothetical protein
MAEREDGPKTGRICRGVPWGETPVSASPIGALVCAPPKAALSVRLGLITQATKRLRQSTARFPSIATLRSGDHLLAMFVRAAIIDAVLLSAIVAELASAAVRLAGG